MVPPQAQHDREAEVNDLRSQVAKMRVQISELEAENERLREQVQGLERQGEQLLRKVLGETSEKMPSLEREVRRREDEEQTGEERRKRGRLRRQENAAKRERLETEEVDHPVAEEDRSCPNCPGAELRPMPPESSVEYEFVPSRMKRRVHRREKLSCPRCRSFIVTASAPTKVYDKAHYGPGLFAHLITAKCADSIPLYRQAKRLARQGIPMSRSTLTDLFHRAAELLKPLVVRFEQRIAESPHVLADETSFRVLAKGGCRRGFIWTFIGDGLVLYRYSATRSGETPQDVLGGTTGKLLVDGYTGYNHVCDVAGRERAGCMCHLRRYFFEARSTAPEPAQHVLDAIVEIYLIERKALKLDIVGTEAHRRLRQAETRPMMDALKIWLEEQQPLHRPKSPIARAIGYGLNQWQALTRFLDDPLLPPDNNESERRLRLIALGRKNYLFAGHDAGAENLAILMSLVVTCEAHGVDPEAYLADVLIRIQTHPQSDIDQLLPPVWAPVALDETVGASSHQRLLAA